MSAKNRLSTRRRVERHGKKLMQEVYGDEWYTLINEDVLSISYTETCPFAQASGTGNFNAACKRAGIEPHDVRFQTAGIVPYNGFDRLDPRVSRRRRIEIARLNRHWKALIVRLKARDSRRTATEEKDAGRLSAS